MPQPDTDVHAETGPQQSTPSREERRAELKRMQNWMEQKDRYSLTGHIGALTEAVLEIQDDNRDTNHRLGRIESDVSVLKSDMAEVKSDVSVLKSDMAEVKSDLGRVDKQLGLLTDEARKTGARVEELVRYIIRDEQGDPDARAALTG